MPDIIHRLIYSLWYFFNPPWDTGVTPPEVVEAINGPAALPPGRALDLGCGTGTNSLYLARHGWQVVGVDMAVTAILQARRKARGTGLKAKFYAADVTRLDFLEPPFDLALDIGCFHSLAEIGRAAYRRNLAHLLAPQGLFLLYAFLTPHGVAGPGLQPADLVALETTLVLLRRQDGQDRGQQASAWLTYRPKKS